MRKTPGGDSPADYGFGFCSVYSTNTLHLPPPCRLMPKTTPDFDPETYAPVAERIELFYERFPTGRILTELVQHTEREVIFRAAVYRAAEDREPAATGWAAERVGDGEVNAVACLENTETSAIGRALANLGFLASRLRPSAEEVGLTSQPLKLSTRLSERARG